METFSDSEIEKIVKLRKLEENAIALARKSQRQTPEGEIKAFIAFSSGTNRYLVDADHVIEVVKYREVVQLPGIDRKLDGVYNFRGTVTGVYSVKFLLGEEDSNPGEPRYLLICNYSGINFALACEDITGIESRQLSQLKIDESSDILKNIFSGVFSDSARLLDVGKLISDRILKIS